MSMTPYETYKCYLALKLHFTTDSYDIIKNRGRVKASKDSFLKRRDLYAISTISKRFVDEEIVNFLVANFVSGNRWGGVFDSSAKETYLNWKGKIESLSYTFKNDLVKIHEETNLAIEKVIFDVNPKEHPYLLKAYLGSKISLETLVILNKIYKYATVYDVQLEDKLVWPDVSRTIKKYSPFLKINKEKYGNIINAI